MQEVYEFLKKAETYYLATVEGDQPRVRPFGTVDLFEGKLYIQTGKRKDVSKQLQANPKAEICCFGDGKWIRIQADLIWDDRPETIKFLLDQNPNLRRMYSEDDGNCLGLRYENAVATIYSFSEEPRTVKF